MTERVPDDASERRLDQLRSDAERMGRVDAPGVRPAGAPFPIASAATGYYGVPLLKPPVWTWEVPAYFFAGGTAGACAVVAAAARATDGSPRLVRDARRLAAVGAMISAPLLISDLGRPERFLNMLRVFKPQSAMSVGAWTLTAFGAFATGAVIADELHHRARLRVGWIADGAGALSAAAGLVMSTYTGVLLGATAIPVWSDHAWILPAYFAASALSSGVAAIELSGHRDPGLNALGIAAAAVKTSTGASIEVRRTASSAALRGGPNGIVMRVGGVLSGPLPLALRLLGGRSIRARRLAAVSSLAGSLLTRLAWVEAGKVSARARVGDASFRA